MRLPPQQATQLRTLVGSIENNNSSTFIAFPGMNSLYLWTNEEPPTKMRYELWWLTVDDADQESMVQRLEAQSRLCVVKNQSLIDFWTQGHSVPVGPLVDFIDEDFVDAGSYGDYELLIRREGS